jgi:hypothetical protein
MAFRLWIAVVPESFRNNNEFIWVLTFTQSSLVTIQYPSLPIEIF